VNDLKKVVSAESDEPRLVILAVEHYWCHPSVRVLLSLQFFESIIKVQLLAKLYLKSEADPCWAKVVHVMDYVRAIWSSLPLFPSLSFPSPPFQKLGNL
jgi:hypothetical protein|tara:strand:- start:5054 stop:5350 length:297 start_codon:yes stop_codon:yes gene_type:complete